MLVEPSIISTSTCGSTGFLLTNDDGSGFWLPSAFTPNGDGLNDSYRIFSNGVKEFTLTISNGKKTLFQTKSISILWDGKVDGRIADQGTYQVGVQGTFKNGQPFVTKTRVYLILVCRDKLVPACNLGDQFTNSGLITGSISNDPILWACN